SPGIEPHSAAGIGDLNLAKIEVCAEEVIMITTGYSAVPKSDVAAAGDDSSGPASCQVEIVSVVCLGACRRSGVRRNQQCDGKDANSSDRAIRKDLLHDDVWTRRRV